MVVLNVLCFGIDFLCCVHRLMYVFVHTLSLGEKISIFRQLVHLEQMNNFLAECKC